MKPTETRTRLKAHALSLPETYEDHPWGESVVKVGKKVFVFFGMDGGYSPGMTVKLIVSQPLALAQPGAVPSGYGLGDSGWVTIRFSEANAYEMLREWVEESYRAVAPKTLARQLG